MVHILKKGPTLVGRTAGGYLPPRRLNTKGLRDSSGFR